MSTIKEIISLVAEDQMADAITAVQDTLARKVLESLDARKMDIAEQLFTGSQEVSENVEQVDEEQLDELDQKTLRSYIHKNIKSGRANDGGKGDEGLSRATEKVAKKQATSTLDKKVNRLGNTPMSHHKNPYEYDASREELKNRNIHHFGGRRIRK